MSHFAFCKVFLVSLTLFPVAALAESPSPEGATAPSAAVPTGQKTADVLPAQSSAAHQPATTQPPTIAPPQTFPYGPDPLEQLDLYPPISGATAVPAIIMVHGGAWHVGDKSDPDVWASKAAYWGARGYALVSVDYPMLPQAHPLDQAKAVARAVAWVQGHAAELQIDKTRIVLMGHSAGAHLVSLLGADPALAAQEGAGPVKAVIGLDSAAYDVATLMQHRDVLPRLYTRAFGTDPAYWAEVSPLAQIHAPVPQWLLVCGTKRRTVCADAGRFKTALEAAGAQVTLLPVELRHNAINAQAGLPGPETEAIDALLHKVGLP